MKQERRIKKEKKENMMNKKLNKYKEQEYKD